MNIDIVDDGHECQLISSDGWLVDDNVLSLTVRELRLLKQAVDSHLSKIQHDPFDGEDG